MSTFPYSRSPAPSVPADEADYESDYESADSDDDYSDDFDADLRESSAHPVLSALSNPARSESPTFLRRSLAHHPLISPNRISIAKPNHNNNPLRQSLANGLPSHSHSHAPPPPSSSSPSSASDLFSALDLHMSSSLPDTEILRQSYQKLVNQIQENWGNREKERAGQSENRVNKKKLNEREREKAGREYVMGGKIKERNGFTAATASASASASAADHAVSAPPRKTVNFSSTIAQPAASHTAAAHAPAPVLNAKAAAKHLERLKAARTRDPLSTAAGAPVLTQHAADKLFFAELDRDRGAPIPSHTPNFSSTASSGFGASIGSSTSNSHSHSHPHSKDSTPVFQGKALPAAPQNLLNPSRIRSTIDNRMPEYILRVLNSRKVRKKIFGPNGANGNRNKSGKQQSAKVGSGAAAKNGFSSSQGPSSATPAAHRHILNARGSPEAPATSSVPVSAPVPAPDFALADSLVADRELEELLLTGRLAGDSPEKISQPETKKPTGKASFASTNPIPSHSQPHSRPFDKPSASFGAGHSIPQSRPNHAAAATPAPRVAFSSTHSTSSDSHSSTAARRTPAASSSASSAVQDESKSAASNKPEHVEKMKREMNLLKTRIAALEQANKQLKMAAQPAVVKPQESKSNVFLAPAAQQTLFQRLNSTKRVPIGVDQPRRAQSASRSRPIQINQSTKSQPNTERAPVLEDESEEEKDDSQSEYDEESEDHDSSRPATQESDSYTYSNQYPTHQSQSQTSNSLNVPSSGMGIVAMAMSPSRARDVSDRSAAPMFSDSVPTFSSSSTSGISIPSSIQETAPVASNPMRSPPRYISGDAFISPRSILDAQLASRPLSAARSHRFTERSLDESATSAALSSRSHHSTARESARDDQEESDRSEDSEAMSGTGSDWEYEASELPADNKPTAMQLRFMEIAQAEAKMKEEEQAKLAAADAAVVAAQAEAQAQPLASQRGTERSKSKLQTPRQEKEESYSSEEFERHAELDQSDDPFLTSPAPPRFHLDMAPPTARFASRSPSHSLVRQSQSRSQGQALSRDPSVSELHSSRSSSSQPVSAPPSRPHSSKLDLSSLHDRNGRARFMADPLSDSFEITESGAFKRGDFILTRQGLHHAKSDASAASHRSASSSSSSLSLSSHRTEFLLNADDFYILSVLGRGASAVVYRCFHGPTMHQMALKAISITEKDKRQQLGRELSTLIQLQHPNLIRFEGAYFDQQQISIALEFMDRGSLQDLIEWQLKTTRAAAGDGAADLRASLDRSNQFPDPATIKPLFPERFIAYIFEQIFLGLEFIHSQHRLHRDLKPHNVLVNSHYEFRISDYGIMGGVNEHDDDQANKAELFKTFVGTVLYMSRERIHGAPYTYSSDIWALGLTLLTAVVGYYPIRYQGHWQLIQAIETGADGILQPFKHLLSPALTDFLAICLHTDPTRRSSARDLLQHQFFAQYRVQSEKSVDRPNAFIEELERQRTRGAEAEKSLQSPKEREKEEKNRLRQMSGVAELIARCHTADLAQVSDAHLKRIATELEFPLEQFKSTVREQLRLRKFPPRP